MERQNVPCRLVAELVAKNYVLGILFIPDMGAREREREGRCFLFMCVEREREVGVI